MWLCSVWQRLKYEVTETLGTMMGMWVVYMAPTTSGMPESASKRALNSALALASSKMRNHGMRMNL